MWNSMGPVYSCSCMGLSKYPYSSTGEKSFYLLFDMGCCTPKEAALLPFKPLRTTEISDYQEEMVITLSSAGALALKSNQKSSQQYKK